MTHLIKDLAHIGILTDDMDKSIAFYTDLLELDLFYDTVVPSGTRLVFLRAGSLVIELIGKDSIDKTASGALAHIAIEVVGLDSIVQKLRDAGINTFQTEKIGVMPTLFPKGSRMMFFAGPMGETIELYEYSI